MIREKFGSDRIEFILVDKHKPLSAYPSWHPLAALGAIAEKLPRGRRKLEHVAEPILHPFGWNRLQKCDLVIQSGAPVIFEGCGRAEWVGPIWDRIIGSMYRRTSVWNIAAGSCFPWLQQPRRIVDPIDAEFLERISSYCRITTVREELAQHLLAENGQRSPLIACTAFLAGLGVAHTATDSSPILVNYMEGAGHYSFGQGISADRWAEQLGVIVNRLNKRHKICFLCHTRKEFESVRRRFPEFQAELPRSTEDYFHLISGAKAGLYNRLHASVALGGIGGPSLAIGTDTRMLMLKELGLQFRYVGAVDVDEIEQALEETIKRRKAERDRLLALREEVHAKYRTVLSIGVK